MKHELVNKITSYSILPILILIIMQLPPTSSVEAMDLMEAYARAKEHDPLLGSSFYEHEAAKTLPAQGRSYLLPQIQIFGSESGYYYASAPSNYLNFNSMSIGVSIKQSIFNLSRFYEYKQKQIGKDIGDTKYKSAEQDLIFRLTGSYFDALAAEDSLKLIDAERNVVLEQLEQARHMLQSGVATITDVHDAESRRDSVRAKEIEAKSNLDVKMLALKRIIGTQPNGLPPLREDAPITVPAPDNLDSWIEKARTSHPLLKSYEYQVSFQEVELRKARGERWPTLDLAAGYNKTNTNNVIQTGQISYGNVGVQLTVPISNGGFTSAKVKESRALLEQSRKQYENALADITQKLSEAFLGIRNAASKVDALQTAGRSALESLKSNKVSLTAGIRTTSDVLNAERDLEDIQISLLKARYDGLMNIVKLKTYAGTISENDLQEINAWLQTPVTK
jgi:outer membrane protein